MEVANKLLLGGAVAGAIKVGAETLFGIKLDEATINTALNGIGAILMIVGIFVNNFKQKSAQ